jgi:hypothetical protein
MHLADVTIRLQLAAEVAFAAQELSGSNTLNADKAWGSLRASYSCI